MKLVISTVAACGVVTIHSAAGQVLGPIIRANERTTIAGVQYEETAIAVNPTNENDLVALSIRGMLGDTSSNDVYIAATLDGGQSFHHRAHLRDYFPGQVFPGCAGNPNSSATVDPFATTSRTIGAASSNYFWFGCQTNTELTPSYGGYVVV